MPRTGTWTPRSLFATTSFRWILMALGLCLVLTLSLGCTTEMVKLRSTPHRPLDEMLNVGNWGGPKPGERTRLFLRMYDLELQFDQNPKAALKQICDILRHRPQAENLYYFAELNYVAGCRVEKRNPDHAAEYFAATTVASYCYLFHPMFAEHSNPYDPLFRNACDLYNGSLEKSLRLVDRRSALLPDHQYDLDFQGERQTVSAYLRNSAWKPTQVDHFEFVADYELEGLQNHHRTYGLGVPLIAVCKLPTERSGADRYLPPACCFPVTAFLRPNMDLLLGGDTAGPAIHTLDLYDTSRETVATPEGQKVSLETDFSTVLAWQLSSANDMKISTLGLLRPDRMLGSWNPNMGGTIAGFSESDVQSFQKTDDFDESPDEFPDESPSDTVSLQQRSVDPDSGETTLRTIGRSDDSNHGRIAGLYMIRPYEPGRIPVIMVHGLWSSPMTWIQMFNDLHADPLIRDRYQFWFYLYPTGLPYWSSAALLRQDLKELRQTIDPNRQDAALDQMVLIGHSMGGLLSEMQIISSGDEVWRLVSHIEPEELKLSADAKQLLRKTFFFEANPSIRRVITLATPYHGSRMSNSTTQWFMTKFMRWPEQYLSANRTFFRENADSVPTDSLLHMNSSVDSLAPNVPLHELLLSLPALPGVHRNNIVGDLPPEGVFHHLRRQNPGDGVVSVESAHLPQAESEITVPANHTTIHSNPRAILEVRRLLYEHLENSP